MRRSRGRNQCQRDRKHSHGHSHSNSHEHKHSHGHSPSHSHEHKHSHSARQCTYRSTRTLSRLLLLTHTNLRLLRHPRRFLISRIMTRMQNPSPEHRRPRANISSKARARDILL